MSRLSPSPVSEPVGRCSLRRALRLTEACWGSCRISKSAIDDLWAEFNAPAASPAPQASSSATATTAPVASTPTSTAPVKAKAPLVKIKVTHTFVGETIE